MALVAHVYLYASGIYIWMVYTVMAKLLMRRNDFWLLLFSIFFFFIYLELKLLSCTSTQVGKLRFFNELTLLLLQKGRFSSSFREEEAALTCCFN